MLGNLLSLIILKYVDFTILEYSHIFCFQILHLLIQFWRSSEMYVRPSNYSFYLLILYIFPNVLKYFILGELMKMVFLISDFNCSLLVFGIQWQLTSAYNLESCNLTIIANQVQDFFFLVNCFLIFYINNHDICKQRQFIFFLPSLYTFYFLIKLARTYSRMLKSSGERGHSYLVHDLSRKGSSFSP